MNNQVELPACDYTPESYSGPAFDEVLKTRQKYCNPAIFHFYRNPIMIVDGYMQYLFDEKGTRYLDLIAGIATVSCGHCHPHILAAATSQLEKLQHGTTVYLHPHFGEFAKRLAATMPDGLEVTYFVNSGSEANDLAMTLARLHTGNFDVVALRNAYHGGVSSVMGLTSHHTWKYPVPHGYGIHHVACPDPYRSPYSGTPAEVAEKSAEDLVAEIQFSSSGKLAAFIAEPLQGVGGVTGGSPEYMQRAYEVTREHGGLCIADEVQTGFGRTGTNYWGFQNLGVTPDIVTMAKGIGNGIPLAAVTTTKEIAAAFAQRIHFNTFGGNPVSMAQGIAVLEVIEKENLQENAHVVGEHMLRGLRSLSEKYKLIGDVRGKGLMIGVEMVRDRQTKEPASLETAELFEALKDEQVLVGKGGLQGNVLRVKPPLCVTKEDMDFALDRLDHVLGQITS